MGKKLKADLDVLGDVIESLLDIRDFLGHQLNHAWGNTTKKDFEKIANPFLDRQITSPKNLEEKVVILLRLPSVADQLDPEIVSAVFRCTLGEAVVAFANAKVFMRLGKGPQRSGHRKCHPNCGKVCPNAGSVHCIHEKGEHYWCTKACRDAKRAINPSKGAFDTSRCGATRSSTNLPFPRVWPSKKRRR